jgi:hypothetical protein
LKAANDSQASDFRAINELRREVAELKEEMHTR